MDGEEWAKQADPRVRRLAHLRVPFRLKTAWQKPEGKKGCRYSACLRRVDTLRLRARYSEDVPYGKSATWGSGSPSAANRARLENQTSEHHVSLEYPAGHPAVFRSAASVYRVEGRASQRNRQHHMCFDRWFRESSLLAHWTICALT